MTRAHTQARTHTHTHTHTHRARLSGLTRDDGGVADAAVSSLRRKTRALWRPLTSHCLTHGGRCLTAPVKRVQQFLEEILNIFPGELRGEARRPRRRLWARASALTTAAGGLLTTRFLTSPRHSATLPACPATLPTSHRGQTHHPPVQWEIRSCARMVKFVLKANL